MGSASSFSRDQLKALSARELANILPQIGSAYEQYASAFIENGIDGEFLFSLKTEDIFNEALAGLGITNPLHRRVLFNKFFQYHTTPTPASPPVVVAPSSSSAQSQSQILTDVFLTHDWGKGQLNHMRVSKVNRYLQGMGISTWFDEEKMEGDIRKQMTRGIENTCCAAVFITNCYRNKINGNNDQDNCQFEFDWAVRSLGKSHLLPVVMEAEMRNTLDWKGDLGAVLGGLLYDDLSMDDETTFNSNCRILGEKILKLSQAKKQKSSLTNEEHKHQQQPSQSIDTSTDFVFLLNHFKRSNNETERMDILVRIRILCRDETLRRTFMSCGGEGEMIEVLKTGSMAEKTQAASAIMNISGAEENRVPLMQSGVVPPLISLLSNGNDEAKSYAAAAINNIAIAKENKVPLMQLGVVPPLISLLSNGNDKAKSNAAGAIRSISGAKENKVPLMQSGVVPPLISLLSNGNDEAKANAAAAIQNIAGAKENKVPLMQSGVIPPLISLLSNGNDEAKTKAASAIMNISGAKENKVPLMQSGVVPPLISLLSNGNDQAKAKAAAAILNISIAQENKVTLMQSGVVPPLISLLSNGNDEAKSYAKKTLELLDQLPK